MQDESKWSTRYYSAQCPDLQVTMKTDGPDDRPDLDSMMPCLLEGHGRHPVVRISPDEWRRRCDEDEPDDDDVMVFDPD